MSISIPQESKPAPKGENYNYYSSEDEEPSQKEIQFHSYTLSHPPNQNIYLFPSLKHLSRHSLISKIDLLTKIHSKSESRLLLSGRGWQTLYIIFFSKFFLLKKSDKSKKVIINLKEVESRIRKEINKIATTEEPKVKKDARFVIFNKNRYNPPVSNWYKYNVITEQNFGFSNDHKDSFISSIIEHFNTLTDPQKENVPKRKVSVLTRASSLKSRKSLPNLNMEIYSQTENKYDKGIDQLVIQLERRQLNTKVDNVHKKKELPFGLGKESKLVLKEFLIPKGATKKVEEFLKLHKNTNFNYVEKEINYINNKERAYEIETRNPTTFENDYLKGYRYVFDFERMGKIIENGKNKIQFNMKKEQKKLLYQLVKVGEFHDRFINNKKEKR